MNYESNKKIFKLACKNKLSIVQIVSSDFIMNPNNFELDLEVMLKRKSIEEISHAIAQKMKYEQEIGGVNKTRFYSSIYAFSEYELLEFVKFVREIEDA